MKKFILFSLFISLTACETMTPPEDLGEQTMTIAGNKVSKKKYNDYVKSLYEHMKPRLQPAEELATENKKASVRIRFNEKGELIENKLFSASGDKAFDNKVVALAKSCEPLPPPPKEIADFFKDTGILINFP